MDGWRAAHWGGQDGVSPAVGTEVAKVQGHSQRRQESGRGQREGLRGQHTAPCLARRRCPFDFAVRQAELTGHLFLLD